MDAPKDVGQRNIAAVEEGGQQQMHDDKPHKQPMLKKVRDKMKKIRNTITGHGHGNGDEHEHEHDTGGSSSIDMDEDDAALREDEMEKGGYQEDVEDKRVRDSGPELHGAPMYDSETIPSAAKDGERNDVTGMRLGDLGGQAAAKGVERNDDPAVRYGDLGAGGNALDDSGTTEPMAVDAGKRDLDLPKEGTPASYPGTEELKKASTDATTEGAPAATYTDMITSAAAGTTEYGMQLASSVYGKVAGVGTAMASRVMPSSGTASPDIGAQDGSAAATVTPRDGGPGSGQDKGVSGVTSYIAEMLRPGDEERALSESITGAVQQRKEGVGSSVAKAREVPAQAVTRARDAVTSLTGGNRVSETVQPTTEGNNGGGVAAEGPTLRGEGIAAPRTNTNVM